MCRIITVLFIIDPWAEDLLARRRSIEEYWHNNAVEAGIPYEDWEVYIPSGEDWGNDREAQYDPPSEGILASTNCVIMCGLLSIGLMYFLFKKNQINCMHSLF